MKTAKSQGLNKSLKQVNKDSSTSKINNYFKPATKSLESVEEKKDRHTEGPKQFYIQVLKDKLQAINGTDEPNQMGSNCAVIEHKDESVATLQKDKSVAISAGSTSQGCSECKQTRKECLEWKSNYKNMKKMFVELSTTYAELDMKHKHLVKSVTGKSGARNAVSAEDKKVEDADSDIFTDVELKYLECMHLPKKKDSTFVLQCLQFLYKDNPQILATKSRLGTKESITFTEDGVEVRHPAKQPMTPTKTRRIKELFVERISKCNISSAEYAERIHEPYVHRLLASGIKNMSK